VETRFDDRTVLDCAIEQLTMMNLAIQDRAIVDLDTFYCTSGDICSSEDCGATGAVAVHGDALDCAMWNGKCCHGCDPKVFENERDSVPDMEFKYPRCLWWAEI
jgi:hypothetical protein